MGRNAQLIRQWKILRLLALHRYGLTIEDLAGRMEVSTRTIRRDLDCLNAAGFDLFALKGETDSQRWVLGESGVNKRFLGELAMGKGSHGRNNNK